VKRLLIAVALTAALAVPAAAAADTSHATEVVVPRGQPVQIAFADDLTGAASVFGRASPKPSIGAFWGQGCTRQSLPLSREKYCHNGGMAFARKAAPGPGAEGAMIAPSRGSLETALMQGEKVQGP
jgi:hypothetical protein